MIIFDLCNKMFNQISYGPMSIIYLYVPLVDFYESNQNLICKNFYKIVSKCMHLRKETYYHDINFHLPRVIKDFIKNKYISKKIFHAMNKRINYSKINKKIFFKIVKDHRLDLSICVGHILKYSVRCGHIDIAKFLLENSRLNIDGYGLIELSIKTYNIEMLKLLFSHPLICLSHQEIKFTLKSLIFNKQYKLIDILLNREHIKKIIDVDNFRQNYLTKK